MKYRIFGYRLDSILAVGGRVLAMVGLAILVTIIIVVVRVSLARAETTNEYWVYRWQALTSQCIERKDSACEAAKIVSDDLKKRGCVRLKDYWNCEVPNAGQKSTAPVVPPPSAPCSTLIHGDGPDVPITLRGEIVESAFMANAFDGTGREIREKYFAIVPDDPPCSAYETETQSERLIVLQWRGFEGLRGPSKWLGHHVEIHGTAGIPGTAHWPTTVALSVESIKDAQR